MIFIVILQFLEQKTWTRLTYNLNLRLSNRRAAYISSSRVNDAALVYTGSTEAELQTVHFFLKNKKIYNKSDYTWHLTLNSSY